MKSYFLTSRITICAIAALVALLSPPTTDATRTIPSGTDLLRDQELLRERIGSREWIFNRDFDPPTEARAWYVQEVRPITSEETTESYTEGARMIVEQVRENPGFSMLLFRAAEYFSRADKMDDARDTFEEAVRRHPDLRPNPGIYAFLARSYMRHDDEEKRVRSREYFTKAMENPRLIPDVVGFLGYTHYRREFHLPAEFAFRHATLLNPDQEVWNTPLADALRAQDKLEASSAMVQLILRSQPESQELWLLLANNYLGRERIDEAAQIYEMLLRMGKATVESLHLLGRIHINNENVELAYNAHREALLLQPDQNARELLDALRSFSNFGAFEQALRLIADIREHIERELTREQEVRLLTTEAEIMIAQGRGEEAVEPLEGILEREPDNARALMTLARHYERDARENRAHAERAKELYRAAMELEDHEVDARIRLAQLHVRLQNWIEARDLLATALEMREDPHVERYFEQIEQRVRVYEATGR